MMTENYTMKRTFAVKSFILALLLFLNTSITNADEWSGHIGGFVGLKFMNSSDWPDLNTPFAMGVIFDIKKESWPISIVLDIFDTGDEYNQDGMTNLGHTTEIQLGVRKFFVNKHPKIQPYIGGGVSFMSAELEYQENNTTTTQDDSTVGGWLGAGMFYEIDPKFVLGLDVRYSYGEVTLFDIERDAGGFYTGVTAAFQF